MKHALALIGIMSAGIFLAGIWFVENAVNKQTGTVVEAIGIASAFFLASIAASLLGLLISKIK